MISTYSEFLFVFAQGEGTVTDVILSTGKRNDRNSSGSSRSAPRVNSTGITPVGAWEEAEENTSSSCSSSTVEGVRAPALWAAQRAAEQALAASAKEDGAAPFEKVRPHHAEAILAENEELVRQFLDGQLCVSTI